jgi:hypothetical protein
LLIFLPLETGSSKELTSEINFQEVSLISGLDTQMVIFGKVGTLALPAPTILPGGGGTGFYHQMALLELGFMRQLTMVKHTVRAFSILFCCQ